MNDFLFRWRHLLDPYFTMTWHPYIQFRLIFRLVPLIFFIWSKSASVYRDILLHNMLLAEALLPCPKKQLQGSAVQDIWPRARTSLVEPLIWEGVAPQGVAHTDNAPTTHAEWAANGVVHRYCEGEEKNDWLCLCTPLANFSEKSVLQLFSVMR